MIPIYDGQSAIRETRRRLLRNLGWRKRRNLSLALARILRPLVGDEKATQVATDLTDVLPQPWLTVSEAKADLDRIGIPYSQRSLQRMAKKATMARDGVCTVWLNAQGDWDGEHSPTLRDPVVSVAATITANCARFLVRPLSLNGSNDDTQTPPSWRHKG